MKKFLLSTTIMLLFAITLSAQTTITLGEKITTTEEIKSGNLYVLQGLLDCDPVNGYSGAKGGGYYKSSKSTGTRLDAGCAFLLTATGFNDDTFYLQSLADGSFWCTSDTTYFADGTKTCYRSLAAKVKFVPNNNDGLPGSFVIYRKCKTRLRWQHNFNPIFDSTGLGKELRMVFIPHPCRKRQHRFGRVVHLQCRGYKPQ